jgi:hypothetical protein
VTYFDRKFCGNGEASQSVAELASQSDIMQSIDARVEKLFERRLDQPNIANMTAGILAVDSGGTSIRAGIIELPAAVAS